MREFLQKRAEGLAAVREFFRCRDVLEVDCPALSSYPAIDPHIEPMQVLLKRGMGYLHTSPEIAMKRLLAEGSGDIYYLGHVFRDEESGRWHHPEFTMIEWYRVGYTLKRLIEETMKVARLFVQERGVLSYSYRELFLEYAGFDPFVISLKDLRKRAPVGELDSREDLLQAILAFEVEPAFPEEYFVVVRDYPAAQAMLARTVGEVAMRFELYFGAVELANGYHELDDAEEALSRFAVINEARGKRGLAPLQPNPEFVALLKKLPDCYGVSVGFDRLVALQTGKSISQSILM